MNLQKKKPFESQEYRDFVATLPCCICHIQDDTVAAHHSRTKGAGGGDETCVPLCYYHHINGFHRMGRDTFAKFYKVNIDVLVEQTQAAWLAAGNKKEWGEV